MSYANTNCYERSTAASVPVYDVSFSVVSANPQRKSLTVVNTSVTATVSLRVEGDLLAGQGIVLAPTAGYEWNATNLTHGAIYAVTDSGTGSLAYHEGL